MKISDLVSIPNLLCYIRIILIPFFVYNYIYLDNYWQAILILVIMEVSDFLDGYIARKCKLITNWGKIIDPFADKLLQFALLLVLGVKYPFAFVVMGLFLIKEFVLLLLSLWSIKRSRLVEGARMWGKIATVVFYLVALFLVLIPNVDVRVANVLLAITLVFLLYSFVKYFIFFVEIIKQHKS